MWAQNLKSLDFRLYRVEKAGEFLGQLGDAHSFGNQVADLPKEDTPLAKFLKMKRRLRDRTQLFVRNQFTADARMAWRGTDEAKPVAKAPGEKGTTYASIDRKSVV